MISGLKDEHPVVVFGKKVSAAAFKSRKARRPEKMEFKVWFELYISK
jgi:hypothetical protein